MLDVKLRAVWDRVMHPVGRALAAVGFTPNIVTVLGLAVQVVVAAMIVNGRLLAAGLIGIGGAIADGLDGAVAKARGHPGRFGALLDSTTDRVSDGLLFASVAWLYGVSPDIGERDRPWVAAMALAALLASFLVSYVKARAESLGYDGSGGIAERAERLILLLLGLLFDIVPVMISVIAIAAAITAAQRLWRVRSQAHTSAI